MLKAFNSIMISTMISKKLIALLVCFGLLLSCGKSNTEFTKNTLRIGNNAEPGSLDPHIAEGVPASRILRDLYEGLFEVGEDGSPKAAAAESYTISNDGLEYVFFLKKSARWSNGDPVTAKDFEYGLKRSIDPQTGSHYSQILNMIKNAKEIIAGEKSIDTLGVKAIDTHTLAISLATPCPYFLGLLTHYSSYPVHKESIKIHGKSFTKPGNHISNGPYKIKEWVVQSKISIEKNPYYWDASNVSIQVIEFYPIEDSNTNLKMYRAGQLDVLTEISPKQYAWVKKNLSSELITYPYLGLYYYGLNLSKSPLKNNVNLRKALFHAIDRDVITDKITKSGQIPAYSWVPPNVNAYVKSPEIQPNRDAEIKKAKDYLAKSGYNPSKALKLEILYNTLESHKQIALAIASMWKDVLDIDVKLINQEWKVYLTTRRQKKDTLVFRAGWIADYNDANSFLEILHSQHGLNDSAYNNPAYDSLLEKAALTKDISKRKAILQKAETLILEDVPAIPIYYYTESFLIKPYVKNFKTNIMGAYHKKNWKIEVK